MSEQLHVVYEDNHILVAVKPQNIPSQADDSRDPDMLSLVKAYVKEKYNKPGAVYIGLVHRLDRPAGGLMVFARTSKAASRLSNQIRTHLFDKQYLAVVRGVPSMRSVSLSGWVVKDPATNIVKMCSESTSGAKLAELSYETLAAAPESLSLIRVALVTGRPHQIRVQMAGAGFPLSGDAKYGPEAAGGTATKKLALWSAKLSFTHPVTGEALSFTMAPPDEYPWNLSAFAQVIGRDFR